MIVISKKHVIYTYGQWPMVIDHKFKLTFVEKFNNCFLGNDFGDDDNIANAHLLVDKILSSWHLWTRLTTVVRTMGDVNLCLAFSTSTTRPQNIRWHLLMIFSTSLFNVQIFFLFKLSHREKILYWQIPLQILSSLGNNTSNLELLLAFQFFIWFNFSNCHAHSH